LIRFGHKKGNLQAISQYIGLFNEAIETKITGTDHTFQQDSHPIANKLLKDHWALCV